MADLRTAYKNHQRRVVNAVVGENLSAADVNDIAIIATLPPNALVVGYQVIIKEAAGSGEQINITYNNTAVASDVVVDTVGIVGAYNTPSHAVGGGNISVRPGTTAPTAGLFDVIVEYIDIDKTTGEYTEV